MPTLVVHARGDGSVPFQSGEYLATHIANARLLPIDFPAHFSFLRTTGSIVDWLDDLEEFVTGVRPVGLAVRDVWQSHVTATTPEEAAALCVKAGCDLNGGTTYKALANAARGNSPSQKWRE